MNDQPPTMAADELAVATRKPWLKPELSILPVEETAHSNSSGNDGNGTTTGS